jgi:hypothetical protein
MSRIYSVLCLCPGYRMFCINVQDIQCSALMFSLHCINWKLTQNTVYTGHQHRTLYILDINTEHCIYWISTQNTAYTGHQHKTLCPGYTVFCGYVQDIECSVLMSRIYSVLCLCPRYTVLFVNVQHCISWTLTQNTLYPGHNHRTLYILDINTEHCISWTNVLC